MKLSIVIPVYNGQGYLTQIVDCLKGQTCKNFEAIFINDGSTDDTEARFEQLRPSWGDLDIKMYSQENQGVSVARNLGIQKVTGDFLSFYDVDDVIPPHYVEFILNSFQRVDAELIFWRFIRCSVAHIKVENVDKLKIILLNQQEMLERFLYKRFVAGCWSCAVKISVVQRNQLGYERGIRYGEDLNYVWQILLCSKTVGHIDNPLYYYIVQPNSVMSQFDQRRIEGYRAAVNLTEFVREKAPEFAPLYEKYEAPRILWSIAWQAAVKLDSRKFHEFCDKLPMKETMQALASHPSAKVRMSARLYVISPELFRCIMYVAGKKRCS